MAGVDAEFESPEAFQRFLREAQAHVSDGSGLMQRLGGTLVTQTVRRIKRDNLDADNAPVTKNVKEGDTPLQDTGAFQQSVRFTASEEAVTVGSPLKHTAPLQTGAEIEARKAEKLAFPASARTRTLQGRYGFDFERLITGMREDGWNVWFMENAVMASNPEANDDPFPLLIRKEEVTIPQYEPFQITDEDEEDIRGVTEAWIKEVKPNR